MSEPVSSRLGSVAPRRDALPKAAGSFEFGADLEVPGMLFGATVRSPHARALIRGIDPRAALACEGGAAVLTGADVPGEPRYGVMIPDQPVLASEQVRYCGEPVALVAAESRAQARRAAAAVAVDYEPLAPLLEPERAPHAEPVYADRPLAPGIGLDPHNNIAGSVTIRHGDPEAAAEVSVSGVYEIGRQEQAFLAPESGLAVPAADGGVDLHVATQWLHGDRDQIAPCLGLSREKVRLHLAGVGGAFGGREDITLQIHASMLALATGRPVKMVYGRAESFVGHPHRHPARIWAEHRAGRDGELVCVRIRILLDAGPYASTSPAVIVNAASHACGPYQVPNALIEGDAVYTNNPPSGAMRGFGVPQVCIAHEGQMDRLARELGLDPVELRLINSLEPGDHLPTGQRVEGSLPVAETLRRCVDLEPPPAVADSGGGSRPGEPEPRRGEGLALAYKNIAYSAGFDDRTSARVRLSAGSCGELLARVECAAAEVGQGAHELIERAVRSELDVELVELVAPSTSGIASAGSSSASRMSWMSTGAVGLACAEIRGELERRGGRPLGAGETIEAERTYRHPPTTPLHPGTGQVEGERLHTDFAVVAMRIVVELDPELGVARVLWVGTAQDVGRALNPPAIEGQIEGGALQGIGLALLEELRAPEGRLSDLGFGSYRIPTAPDAPIEFSTDLIERAAQELPHGAKGVGEPPAVVATAAVLAALRDATGLEIGRAPVSPEVLAGFEPPAPNDDRAARDTRDDRAAAEGWSPTGEISQARSRL